MSLEPLAKLIICKLSALTSAFTSTLFGSIAVKAVCEALKLLLTDCSAVSGAAATTSVCGTSAFTLAVNASNAAASPAFNVILSPTHSKEASGIPFNAPNTPAKASLSVKAAA
ncbi:Uncharacterised protein [Acinetobacter baumannii]|nr:Uncharacterised protein [Acinetobacter baumannii]SSU49867.1 Uncharacterised protein [Acinetobacter baumannii]